MREQGWDHEQTLKSLLRKAGYKHSVSAALLEQVQVTRYQAFKHTVAFAEYASQRSP